jgi:hypothetical protein
VCTCVHAHLQILHTRTHTRTVTHRGLHTHTRTHTVCVRVCVRSVHLAHIAQYVPSALRHLFIRGPNDTQTHVAYKNLHRYGCFGRQRVSHCRADSLSLLSAQRGRGLIIGRSTECTHTRTRRLGDFKF